MAFALMGLKPSAKDEFEWLSERLAQVDRTDVFGKRTQQLDDIQSAALTVLNTRLGSSVSSSSQQIEFERKFFEQFKAKRKLTFIPSVAALEGDIKTFSQAANARREKWESYVSAHMNDPRKAVDDYDQSPSLPEKNQLLSQIASVKATAQKALFNTVNYQAERARLVKIVQDATKLEEKVRKVEDDHASTKIEAKCKEFKAEEERRKQAAQPRREKSRIEQAKESPAVQGAAGGAGVVGLGLMMAGYYFSGGVLALGACAALYAMNRPALGPITVP